MYFKSENTKVGFRTYVILAVLLVIYFLGGLYLDHLNSWPKAEHYIPVGIGIAVAIVLVLFVLKKNADQMNYKP